MKCSFDDYIQDLLKFNWYASEVDGDEFKPEDMLLSYRPVSDTWDDHTSGRMVATFDRNSGEGILTILSVDYQQDVKNYWCEIVTLDSQSIDNGVANVSVCPTVSMTSRIQDGDRTPVNDGDSIAVGFGVKYTYECNAMGSRPESEFEWTVGDKPQSDNVTHSTEVNADPLLSNFKSEFQFAAKNDTILCCDTSVQLCDTPDLTICVQLKNKGISLYDEMLDIGDLEESAQAQESPLSNVTARQQCSFSLHARHDDDEMLQVVDRNTTITGERIPKAVGLAATMAYSTKGGSTPIAEKQESNKWKKSAYIDERGGQLSIDGSCAKLKIPPGALPKGQGKLITIGLDWMQEPPLQDNQWVIGPSMQCEPDGLQFDKPVTISLEHSAANITTCDVIIISKPNAHGPRNTWQVLYDEKHMQQSPVTIKLKDNVIKLRVKHFTWYTALMDYITGRQTPTYFRMVMLPFLAPKTLSKATRKVVLRIYSARQDAEKKVVDSEAEFSSVKGAPPKPFLLDLSTGHDLIYHVELDTYLSNKWNQANNDEVVLTKEFQEMPHCMSEFVFVKNEKIEKKVDSIHGFIRGNQGDDPKPCVRNTNFSYEMHGNTSIDELSDLDEDAEPDLDANKEMTPSPSKSDSDFLPFSEKTKSLVEARTGNMHTRFFEQVHIFNALHGN
ncbi:uncharacterized protein [Amphiura filiformis]|uniref:uncharacterized protein n=1 Tax=Amphiura filiformis TaxID=82378 RepID=UPI003B20BD07